MFKVISSYVLVKIATKPLLIPMGYVENSCETATQAKFDAIISPKLHADL